MNNLARFLAYAEYAVAALKKQVMVLKAISFALIGVVNALVDLGVFLLALNYLVPARGVSSLIGALAARSGLPEGDTALVIANGLAWLVAVSGSYVMNSYVTFAAESGRKLTGRAYLTFAASGILGWLANTATVVIAARFVPIVAAKVLAIGAGFIVNFSMSHFVVFRPRGTKKDEAGPPAFGR